MKIFELAKELGKPTGEVVAEAQVLIKRDKNITHMCNLTQDEAVSVRAALMTTIMPIEPLETPVTVTTEPLTDEERAEMQARLDTDTELRDGAPMEKREPTEPWNPAKILEVPEKFKDPNFVYRWVDKDKPGNFRKKLQEGWLVDNELTKKMTSLGTIEDGSAIDGTLQVREMIVMKLPIERAKARKEYYKNKNTAAVQDNAEAFKQRAGGGYGEIKENAVTYQK